MSATPPLVLVPGMLCDERLFAPQAAVLRAHRPVVFADITSDDSIGGMARRLLDAAPPRFALAGLSLGGIVAMEVLRLAPERVEGVALLATNHRAPPPVFRTNREAQLDRARAGSLDTVFAEEILPLYRSSLWTGASEGTVRAMALDAGMPAFASQSFALYDRRDQSPALAAFAGPSLVLAAEEDRLCPVATHEAIAGLMPRARLVIVPRAGHIVTLDAPLAVTQAMAAWLDEVAAAGPAPP